MILQASFWLPSLTGWEETVCLFVVFDNKKGSATTEQKNPAVFFAIAAVLTVCQSI